MNSNLTRLIATAIIWTALTAIVMTGMLMNTDMNFIILAIIFGAGVVGTISVWESAKNDAAQEAEKTKRRGRVDRLLDGLSDAELDDLRARLGASDGEVLGLDDLLAERDRRTRGR